MKAKTNAPVSPVVSEERDLDVEQKLTSLYALQSVDSAIDNIRTLRGELPLEVQDLEDDISGYTSKMEKLHAEIQEINQDISDRKHTVSCLGFKIGLRHTHHRSNGSVSVK